MLNYTDETIVDKIIQRMEQLNQEIRADKNLGEGFQIGHSFFCDPGSFREDDAWYRFVIENEIAPLLQEYWFDNKEVAEKYKQTLLD